MGSKGGNFLFVIGQVLHDSPGKCGPKQSNQRRRQLMGLLLSQRFSRQYKIASKMLRMSEAAELYERAQQNHTM